eukprot:scaffold42691_cov78-Cyclotella_meneghiniana.AAC.11
MWHFNKSIDRKIKKCDELNKGRSMSRIDISARGDCLAKLCALWLLATCRGLVLVLVVVGTY